MFDDAFGRCSLMPDLTPQSRNVWNHSPRTDLAETADAYVVTMDVPGVEKEAIDVRLEGRLLTVSGHSDVTTEQREGDKVLRKERHVGNFHRAVSLPGSVDDSRIEASCSNGVLVVTLPKRADAPSGKKVKVR